MRNFSGWRLWAVVLLGAVLLVGGVVLLVNSDFMRGDAAVLWPDEDSR